MSSNPETPQHHDDSTSLMTYAQASAACLPMRITEDRLRRAASIKLTPIRKRLKVHRFGHRTVGIALADLQDWINRCKS